MLVTLMLALACANSHAQTAASNPSGPSAIPKPLYTQLTEGKPTPEQDAATAKSLAQLREAVGKMNANTGNPSLPPPALTPVSNAANPQANPEEEAAAKYLLEQSKKMKEALKDMELSN